MVVFGTGIAQLNTSLQGVPEYVHAFAGALPVAHSAGLQGVPEYVHAFGAS